jgi:hypothetical protein
MKKLFLFIAFIQLSVLGHAQHVAVSADKMNVLYVGVPNPITVVAEGLQCKNTTIAIEGAQVTPGGEPCRFSVIVKKPGKVIAKVFEISKGGNKIIGEIVFRVKSIPAPQTYIRWVHNGEINKSDLVKQQGIILHVDGFDWDYPYHVTSYTILIVREKNMIYYKDCLGPRFDNELISQFQSLKSGDKIIAYNIESSGPENKLEKLEPIQLTIKN